jgi:hypothetical protein
MSVWVGQQLPGLLLKFLKGIGFVDQPDTFQFWNFGLEHFYRKMSTTSDDGAD